MTDARHDRFLELARLAGRATAPSMDVSTVVLARIVPPATDSLRPLAVAASLSAAAAVVVLFLSVQAWSGLTDPMAGLLCPLELNMVMP